MRNIQIKSVFAAALALSLSLAFGGCANETAPASTDVPSDSGGDTAPSSAPAVDAKTATGLGDFGGLDALAAAAEAEGALNVIALPRTWANFGAVIDAFKAKYPGITVNEQSPDVSSAEEIQAAETNAGLDTAPDVFDLGIAVAQQNTDKFAPYQVATWADIPAEAKDANGLYVGDYGGYMSMGYDSKKYPTPETMTDLLKPEYKGAVAINGDPTQAGAGFAAVGLATLLDGGELSDFQTGIDFFAELNKAGNFLKVDPTEATVVSGETPVVFDWDYLNAAYTKDAPDWKVVVFPQAGYSQYYNQAVNKDAPHPAAARLWEEFLYSDEVQNLWLAGGARPVRMAAMTAAGTIDSALAAALPKAPVQSFQPTMDESAKAAELLGEKWAAAIS
ncbi:MAG: ABC transporter substrate-binding protein [Bifidobacteriaceae bacterium]|nr:ABC transporter substrate-binding protein [Bifidobacteriaceae bacterium]